MTGLLGNRYVPITFTIGFIEMPYDVVYEAFLRWQRDELGKTVSIRTFDASLEKAIAALLPLTGHLCRTLIINTHSKWTAAFDNGIHGAGCEWVSYLCRVIKCRALLTACIPNTQCGCGPYDTKRGTYGSIRFSLYGPECMMHSENADIALNGIRDIQAINDGGSWDFLVGGKSLPFEEKNTYNARRIEERFTPEMLQNYCLAMGIDVFNADFYGPQSCIIDEGAMGYVKTIMTLEEVQREMGM